jgi:hypothetical protein
MCQDVDESHMIFTQLHRMLFSQVPEILCNDVSAEMKIEVIRYYQHICSLSQNFPKPKLRCVILS